MRHPPADQSSRHTLALWVPSEGIFPRRELHGTVTPRCLARRSTAVARNVLAEGRHAPASSRKTPLLIIGGVVVAGALVALVIALSGGSDGPLSLGNDTPETPEFAFKASKPIVITTAANPQPEAPPPTPTQVKAAKKRALAAAQPAADAAVETLDAYYTAAFLDPRTGRTPPTTRCSCPSPTKRAAKPSHSSRS